jgi:hypothetical protein
MMKIRYDRSFVSLSNDDRTSSLKTERKILVYHGTISEFDIFKTHPTEFSGYSGIGETILGAAFSESKEIAASYPYSIPLNSKRRIVTAYIHIKNPNKFRSIMGLRRSMIEFLGNATTGSKLRGGLENATRFREYLEAQDYDSITFLEGLAYDVTKKKARAWIAFYKEQIEIISNEPSE